MASIDLKKVYLDHYRATSEPVLVEIPERRYVMIDGQGDPNTAREYQEAIEALYPIAYGLRAAVKTATGDAYTVMPLEGLWWVADMAGFDPFDKSNWSWTAMICIPDAVTDQMIADVVPAVTAKKKLAAGSKVRVESFTEGPAAQILHIGSYSTEEPTIDSLHRFIDASGHTYTGKHHEIYLSDARKTDPDKLRTIIRQPLRLR